MKKLYCLLIVIAFTNFAFGQGKLPVNILQPVITQSYFNSKPSNEKTFCDSTALKSCFTIFQQDKRTIKLKSIKDTINNNFYFYDSNQLMFFIEFQNDKVNGHLIWFNKRGKMELIARYENSKMIGVLYYRKSRNLKKYYKLFGIEAPVVITNTTHIY